MVSLNLVKRTFAFLLLGVITIVAFAATVYLFSRNLGKGALQVTSEPNSKVYLEGKLLGTTPLCKCDVKDTILEGTYTIRLEPEEGAFPAFEHKISISPKVLTVVDRSFADDSGSSASIITLAKLSYKDSVSLQVTSFPEKAKVFLDSSFVGESPFLLPDTTESDHELKLVKPGYKDKIIPVRTAKGYRLEAQIFLAASLERSPVSSPSASSSPKIAQITILQTPTGFLRVRSEPSLSGKQIALVYPGEKYDLLDEQSGWFKIKLTDNREGWVSSQYSQK